MGWLMSGRSSKSSARAEHPERLVVLLALSIVGTAVLYMVQALRPIAYPLLLLSTYAHEMGHGVGAVLMGGRFDSLLLHADGSGVAVMALPATRMSAAVSSAGGLLGPPIAAAVLLILGTRRRWAQPTLWAMALCSVVVSLWVIRTSFGLFFVLSFAGLCVLLARWARPVGQQFWIIFIATQLGMSVFSRGDYLFTPHAETAHGLMPSDVAQISSALFGPYWLWGGLIALFSGALLWWALRFYVRAALAQRA